MKTRKLIQIIWLFIFIALTPVVVSAQGLVQDEDENLEQDLDLISFHQVSYEKIDLTEDKTIYNEIDEESDDDLMIYLDKDEDFNLSESIFLMEDDNMSCKCKCKSCSEGSCETCDCTSCECEMCVCDD